jgi:hypothetical protein
MTMARSDSSESTGAVWHFAASSRAWRERNESASFWESPKASLWAMVSVSVRAEAGGSIGLLASISLEPQPSRHLPAHALAQQVPHAHLCSKGASGSVTT